MIWINIIYYECLWRAAHSYTTEAHTGHAILPSFHPSILPSFYPSILPSFHPAKGNAVNSVRAHCSACQFDPWPWLWWSYLNVVSTPHFPLPSSTWFNIPLLIKQLLWVPILRQRLYHHFNFALSLRLCNVSKPMSPLTASLQVLDEHPRIHLAPSNIMDSKKSAWLLLPSHTSLPYSILGLITDNNKCLRALKLIFLLLIISCS